MIQPLSFKTTNNSPRHSPSQWLSRHCDYSHLRNILSQWLSQTFEYSPLVGSPKHNPSQWLSQPFDYSPLASSPDAGAWVSQLYLRRDCPIYSQFWLLPSAPHQLLYWYALVFFFCLLTSVRGLQKLAYWVFNSAFPSQGPKGTFSLCSCAP